MLSVSPQAVSKWENDQTCPDISLLPELWKTIGVSANGLLSGHPSKTESAVKLVPAEEREELNDMVLRIRVNSDGTKHV